MSFSPIGAFRMPPDAAGAGVGAAHGFAADADGGADGGAGHGDDVDYAEDAVSALVFAGVDAAAARRRLRTRSSGGSSDMGAAMGFGPGSIGSPVGSVVSPIAAHARVVRRDRACSADTGSFDGVGAQVDALALTGAGRHPSAFGRLSLGAPALPVVAYGCVKPMNFAQVEPGLYRSGYPTPASFGYLERLGVRTIVCVSVATVLSRRIVVRIGGRRSRVHVHAAGLSFRVLPGVAVLGCSNLYAAVFPEDYKAWTRLRGVNLMRFCISGNKVGSPRVVLACACLAHELGWPSPPASSHRTIWTRDKCSAPSLRCWTRATTRCWCTAGRARCVAHERAGRVGCFAAKGSVP